MNRENLSLIINQYVARFAELNDPNGNDEGYKWRAETCFKQYWDIDAENFPDMFRLAMSEMSNLIDNKTVQPVGGISNLLKHDDEVEFVRECFRELFFEDGGDLEARQSRVESFTEKINARIAQYWPGSWKYPQAINNAIYYLNLWHPEENYIFKSTEATAWADCIGFGDDFGSGTTFSLAKYYKMCDELLGELPGYEELIRLHNKRFAEEARGFDDKLHILVYDIFYCAYHYGFYTGMHIPKISIRERIKSAESLRAREKLEKGIQEKGLQLEALQAMPIALPDLTGQIVKHKVFGTGSVVSCANGILEADFAGRQKKFVYPDAVKQGFLTCDPSVMEKIDAVSKFETELKILQKELDDLRVVLFSM